MGMAVAGCGSDDDASPTTGESEQQPNDGNGGGGVGTADGGTSGSSDPASGVLPDSVPDDFEIPFPSGWEIDIHDEIGLIGNAAQLLYAEDRYAEVVAFYDDWTQSRSEEYSRTESGETVIYTRMDGTLWIITVSKDDQRGQNWTLLQVTGGSAEAN